MREPNLWQRSYLFLRRHLRLLRFVLLGTLLLFVGYANTRYTTAQLTPDSTCGEPLHAAGTRFLVDRHAKDDYTVSQLVVYGFPGEPGERIGRVLAVAGQELSVAPAREGPGMELLVDSVRQDVYLRPELDRVEACTGTVPPGGLFFVNLGGASRDPDCRVFGARQADGTVGRPILTLPW